MTGPADAPLRPFLDCMGWIGTVMATAGGPDDFPPECHSTAPLMPRPSHVPLGGSAVPPSDRDTLGDDFRVEAAITVDQAHDAVLVPLAALFRQADDEAVFVVSRNRARLVPVKTGRRGDREAEVLEGLTGDESVIVYPADTITDGTVLQGR